MNEQIGPTIRVLVEGSSAVEVIAALNAHGDLEIEESIINTEEDKMSGLGRMALAAAAGLAAMGAAMHNTNVQVQRMGESLHERAGLRSYHTDKDAHSGRNRHAPGAGMAFIRKAKKLRNKARHRKACR